jgi:fatty acid desaturase
LGHDAAHQQVFRSHRANDWVALLLGAGLGGLSPAWWKTKHTRHHQAPNQIGKDPDIEASIVQFYATDRPGRGAAVEFLQARQGWWFFPLLLGEALHLHARSVYTVITKRDMKRRWVERGLLLIRLGVYPAVLFAFLSWPIAAAFLGVQLALTGLYLGSAFSASHIGMPAVPKDTKIDFLRRQVLMSRNVSGGRTASLAMGGLNYQIEHHLFPAMPRPNLRRARPVVRAFCTEQAIDYHEVPIHRAWAAVARHLNRVGISGAFKVSCPTAASLR